MTKRARRGGARVDPPKTGSGEVKVETVAAGAAALPERIDLDRRELYINRELSLLEFQQRVLEEALDERNPLLERVKFLAIVASNLDEFFMVRVTGLKQQIAAGVFEPSPDGMTPAEQLAAVRKSAARLMADAYACFRERLLPALHASGVHVLGWKELTRRQQQTARRYFDEVVFPVLTPLAFDPGRPFPHISNLSLNLAVLLRDAAGETRFARVKVPDTLPRLVPIKRSSGGIRKDGTVPHDHYFVWLEEVIAANLDTLFPGMTIVEAHPFRVTRNADVEIQELEAADLLETIEESLRRRKFGTVVRLATNRQMPAEMREILLENLEVDRKDLYAMDGPLGLSAITQLASIPLPHLKDRIHVPAVPAAFEDGDIFAAIRREDLLLHHPFDSFKPVIDFLDAASRDRDVLAIKMTLYRVGRNSPVVQSLLDANENHKQVAVLVELKARFDEESNIEWARALEADGVHVVYGLVGLKTHSKVALVVRREGESIRRYVHLATGNYNPTTAQLYTDIGMFTCDEAIGADVTDLFNYLTGYSARTTYRKLLVAPINLRSRLEELIRREIEHQRAGRGGHLIFKVNALVDRQLIRLLYEASQAGVRIDLLVRGICCLRPGVPGVSETITVTSIVGRFLEHSRVLYFANGGNEEIFVGSADLMPRNIDRRVEVLFPVSSPRLVRHLRDDVLALYLADNVRARRMQPDGTYVRLKPRPGEKAVDAQLALMRG
ncbi:MAG TPA: polyphosphate kinase 1 [Thermoanaerobaculaceae bacterium]|nr:polyphosphate kinase 1 [Thermoanaerobaculaceae bacterium]HRS14932.1 polyphosphate kinase 1 [Thermoanaerobaculaceae bacterium]